MRTRVGVIGVGGMGTLHARTLASFSGVDLVAVADPHEPNAIALRDELGCEALTDPHELAVRPDIDGLVIASPDDTHAALTLSAIAHDTFVLCEKPLATTVDDAMRVTAAEAERGGRVVQVGFMREYDPAHVQIVEELPAVGPIDFVRAVHRNANASPRPLEQIVGQSLVHDIHSVRFITGDEITSVTAFGSGPSGRSYRHVMVVCTMASGAHAALEFDDGAFGYDVTVEVLGRQGDVLTSPPSRAITRRDGSVSAHIGTDWFERFADAYRIQDQAWIDSIRAGTVTGPSAWDGVVTQLVVDAILESLATNRSVDVATAERPSIYRVSARRQSGHDAMS